MLGQNKLLAIIFILLFATILGACQKTIPDAVLTPVATTSTISTSTLTFTPSPTSIRTLPPTLTPTFEPTETASPTPEATIQWDSKSLSLTPIPFIAESITAENVAAVDAIAVWGNGKANTIALSPDNSILAVGTGIGVYLYESYNFLFFARLPTSDTVQSIAFSSYENTIALGLARGNIEIFDLDQLSLVRRLEIPNVAFTGPHLTETLFSYDGSRLTSVTDSGSTIHVNRWETATWQSTASFTLTKGLVYYINPDAEILGVLDSHGLTLQSLASLEDVTTLALPASEPSAYWENIPLQNGEIAPSSAGGFILINNGNTILHWDLLEKSITYRLDQYPQALPDPCYQAPNTCRNAQGGFSWTCTTTTNTAPIETIRLTPDDTALLIATNDTYTELRNSANGSLLWRLDAQFTDVSFSRFMDFFIGLKSDGTIEKRNLDNGALLLSLNQHPGQLLSLAFSPNEKILAAGYGDGWVRIYSTFNGELLGVLDGTANVLQFLQDGYMLAAGLADGKVRVFDLGKGSYFDFYNGHYDAVNALTFSADGKTILTGSQDCTVSLWDVNDRFRSSNITPGGKDPFQIEAVAITEKSENLFVLAKDNGVYQVLDTNPGVLIAPVDAKLADMALSPDTRLLAAAGSSIWLIPLKTQGQPGNPLKLSSSTGDPVLVVDFTPNGALLTAVSAEGMEFFSAPDGKSLAVVRFSPNSQHTNPPVNLANSANGSLIALGRQDGLIHIFAVKP